VEILAKVAAGVMLLAYPTAAQIHAQHSKVACTKCHIPAGAFVFGKPGPAQCAGCHPNAQFPPPQHDAQHTITTRFSHAAHIDPKARADAQTGFRADCVYCHKFDRVGVFAGMPSHAQCGACHAKAFQSNDCTLCHSSVEGVSPPVAYANIAFSHASHFRRKAAWSLGCTTCHSGILASTSSAALALPQMLDCVQCHDQPRKMPARSQISNCRTCHADFTEGPLPPDHSRSIKPEFHTEMFRTHHEAEAAAPDAKCFACHQNVIGSASARSQCAACHAVMRPATHTARWKDDFHGKYAALDRTTCATCHQQDYCSRCHNELPRSHVPLPLFKNGGHAVPAMLDQRACLTCHTFTNTCASCHVNQLMKKN